MSMGQLAGRLANAITRSKTVAAVAAGKMRTVLQVLSPDVRQAVEYLEPFGLSTHPPRGTDVILLACNGRADEAVAILGGNAAMRVSDLAIGDVALGTDGRNVTVRVDRLIIRGPLVQIQVGDAAALRLVTEAFKAVFNAHSHASAGAPPSVLMSADHLSGPD